MKICASQHRLTVVFVLEGKRTEKFSLGSLNGMPGTFCCIAHTLVSLCLL
jgi:hypothetical protein